MKLINTLNLKAGKNNYTRAICVDSFKNKEGEIIEFIKVLKVVEGVTLPNGDFTPLYDDKGRVADIKR